MAKSTTAKKKKSSKKKTTKKKSIQKKSSKGKSTKTATKKSTKKTTQKLASPRTNFQVGETIPDFEISATSGKKIRLSELKGKKVVLYFYPKDSTPGCTLEGRDFTRLHNEFEAAGAVVFGVSRDSLKSHENFKSKEGFCFDLLSDETGRLTEMFGVWKEKNLYGRTYMGIERSTFLIGSDGRLLREWRQVRVDGHAQEVLDEVKINS